MAESRLRAARLYDMDGLPYLYVRVGVTARAFATEVSFKKPLIDSASAQVRMATTWETGSYGTHSGNAGYVLQFVSESVDSFILNYLRVNEDACNTPPGGGAR